MREMTSFSRWPDFGIVYLNPWKNHELRVAIVRKRNKGSKPIKRGRELVDTVKEGRQSLNVPKCTTPNPEPRYNPRKSYRNSRI